MKRIIIYILNFILSVLLTIICITTILSKTVLNKNYVIKCLDKSDFYNELHTSIQDEFDTYLAQVGIESGTLKNIYTMFELKESVNNTINAIYGGKSIENNNSVILEKIKVKLGNNISNDILNKLINVYNKKVIISSKYVNLIGSKMTKLTSLVNTGIIAISIFFAIILIIMCVLIQYFKVIINNLGILLCTSGILNIIIKIAIGGKFNNIFLLNTAFSTGVVYIINNIIDKIMSVGIGILVIRNCIYNMW